MQQQQQSPIVLTLDPHNQLELLPQGGRITRLTLSGITVIEAEQPYADLGSGSFLMYPWVSRLEEAPPLGWDNGRSHSLHGMVVDKPCRVTWQLAADRLQVRAMPETVAEGLPTWEQSYVLEKGKLTVRFQYFPKTASSGLPVCFGYHPYLQLGSQPLSALQFQTNITLNLPLHPLTLLPVLPLTPAPLPLLPTNSYNHLFQHPGQGYFRLCEPEGRKVEIRSADMRYWQFYTPGDGRRIAVEPMTFVGNLYGVYREEYGELPKSGQFTISVL